MARLLLHLTLVGVVACLLAIDTTEAHQRNASGIEDETVLRGKDDGKDRQPLLRAKALLKSNRAMLHQYGTEITSLPTQNQYTSNVTPMGDGMSELRSSVNGKYRVVIVETPKLKNAKELLQTATLEELTQLLNELEHYVNYGTWIPFDIYVIGLANDRVAKIQKDAAGSSKTSETTDSNATDPSSGTSIANGNRRPRILKAKLVQLETRKLLANTAKKANNNPLIKKLAERPRKQSRARKLAKSEKKSKSEGHKKSKSEGHKKCKSEGHKKSKSEGHKKKQGQSKEAEEKDKKTKKASTEKHSEKPTKVKPTKKPATEKHTKKRCKDKQTKESCTEKQTKESCTEKQTKESCTEKQTKESCSEKQTKESCTEQTKESCTEERTKESCTEKQTTESCTGKHKKHKRAKKVTKSHSSETHKRSCK